MHEHGWYSVIVSVVTVFHFIHAEWSLQQQYGTRIKSSCPLATASTVYVDGTGSKVGVVCLCV